MEQSTLGGAEGAASVLERAIELLSLGGPVMSIIAVLSVLSLGVVLAKFWQFWRVRVSGGEVVRTALQQWRAGAPSEALRTLAGHPGPLTRVLTVAVEGRARHREQEARVREETARVATAELATLRSDFRTLEVIASLSPLLGLLGTVLGMIEAFQRLQHAGVRVDPAALSGGIWEALLTTAAGLCVAIPTVAALNWFESRVEKLQREMEDAVTQVFTGEVSVAVGAEQPASGRAELQHAH